MEAMTSESKKKIALINASPKIGEASVSALFCDMARARMEAKGLDTARVDVRESITKKQTEPDFAKLREADAMLFAVPLYVFCLPGMLMRFLQDYQAYVQARPAKKAQRVYALVNCGFPEPEINEEAVRALASFARAIGADFGFGVLLGGGPMILGTKDAPFMKKTMGALEGAFDNMADDVISGHGNALQARGNVAIRMNFPRKLYFFMGDAGWKQSARKNGLRKKDLYAKPYGQE